MGRSGEGAGDWVGDMGGWARGRTKTLLHVPPLGGPHQLSRRRRRLARRWAAAAEASASASAVE